MGPRCYTYAGFHTCMGALYMGGGGGGGGRGTGITPPEIMIRYTIHNDREGL